MVMSGGVGLMVMSRGVGIMVMSGGVGIMVMNRAVGLLVMSGGVGLLVMLLLEEEDDDDERLDLSPPGPRGWPGLVIGALSISMPTARLGSEGRDIAVEDR